MSVNPKMSQFNSVRHHTDKYTGADKEGTSSGLFQRMDSTRKHGRIPQIPFLFSINVAQLYAASTNKASPGQNLCTGP